MAVSTLKTYIGSSDKINEIAIKKGNLLYDTEERAIYLDVSNEKRLSFQNIIVLETEQDRLDLEHPEIGFYYEKGNMALWRYDADGWFQINKTTTYTERIIFRPISSLPQDGTGIDTNILYADGLWLWRFYEGSWQKMCHDDTTGSIQWVEV